MTNTSINKTYLIIVLGILAALGPFSIDMYLPGFDAIATTFGTTEKTVTFTLTSYFIGIAIGQLLYGPIVDKYGRKRPLIVGLSIYVLASFGCAFSSSIEMMIAMRFLQALGGCVGMVSSNAIITDVYEPSRTAKAFSLIMLVMGVAPLIAPSVGSMLLNTSDWRSIFLFLSFFSMIVIALIYFTLPETSKHMHQQPLKIQEISANYWSILKNKAFIYNTLAGSFSMAILFAYISSVSFVFLTIYKLDASTFSILFAINATGLITGSYANGFLTIRYDSMKIARVASILLLIVVGIIIGSFTFYQLSYPFAVASIFSILFLVGFINPNTTAASLAPFSKKAGSASALGGSIRMAAGAIAATIVGVFQNQNITSMFYIIGVFALLSYLFIRLAKRDKDTFKKKIN